MTATTKTSFNADDVEDLTYNFDKYGGGSGIIPEPTNEQIKTFQKTLKRTIASAIDSEETSAITPEMTDEEKLKAFVNMPDEAIDQQDGLFDAVLQASAELCSHQPSFEQIKKLPSRTQKAFFGWLSGVFGDPEA